MLLSLRFSFVFRVLFSVFSLRYLVQTRVSKAKRRAKSRELEHTASESRLKLNSQQRQRSGGQRRRQRVDSGKAANSKVLLLLFSTFNFNLWRAFFRFQRSSRHEFRATKNLTFSLRNPSKKAN